MTALPNTKPPYYLVLTLFKAYIIAIPLVLITWQLGFDKPSPHGWDDTLIGAIYRAETLAQILCPVKIGYLICLAGLATGVVAAHQRGDTAALRSSLVFLALSAVSLLLLYLLTQVPRLK